MKGVFEKIDRRSVSVSYEEDRVARRASSRALLDKGGNGGRRGAGGGGPMVRCPRWAVEATSPARSITLQGAEGQPLCHSLGG